MWTDKSVSCHSADRTFAHSLHATHRLIFIRFERYTTVTRTSIRHGRRRRRWALHPFADPRRIALPQPAPHRPDPTRATPTRDAPYRTARRCTALHGTAPRRTAALALRLDGVTHTPTPPRSRTDPSRRAPPHPIVPRCAAPHRATAPRARAPSSARLTPHLVPSRTPCTSRTCPHPARTLPTPPRSKRSKRSELQRAASCCCSYSSIA
jgi:hypothetical protein